MSSIIGYIKIVRAQFRSGLSLPQIDYVDKIGALSKVLLDLLTLVLDVSRMESDSLPLSLQARLGLVAELITL